MTDAYDFHMPQTHMVCTWYTTHKVAFDRQRPPLSHALFPHTGAQSMQQSCPLSVKGSFVIFVLTADHMHLMHMVFTHVNICPQCEYGFTKSRYFSKFILAMLQLIFARIIQLWGRCSRPSKDFSLKWSNDEDSESLSAMVADCSTSTVASWNRNQTRIYQCVVRESRLCMYFVDLDAHKMENGWINH